MISCGHLHTICLDFNGNVYSFGKNNLAQLGLGRESITLEETQIPQKVSLPTIKQISCGSNFTMCVSEDRFLYYFGAYYYRKNYDVIYERNEFLNSTFILPKQVDDLNNIDFVECGSEHIICKTIDNKFYSWRQNIYGQLGQGHNSDCSKPTQCFSWPNNIISIKCGNIHSLLLTSKGEIYSFGGNSNGQLGINDKVSKTIRTPRLIKDIPEIQRIECGFQHSMCIDVNDNLWVFGANNFGQLGLGDTNKQYKPIVHPTLSNIIDISSGGNHTFVKTSYNQIYAFGYNNNSQLGIETSEEYQLIPIQVLKDNSNIWKSRIGKSKQKSALK